LSGFDFWASLPSAVRRRGLPSASTSILPWALPLAGFSDTLPCIARSGSTPTARSSTSGDPRPRLSLRPRALQSAHGFHGVLPANRNAFRRVRCLARDRRKRSPRVWHIPVSLSRLPPDAAGRARCAAGPFSVLMGLMPWPRPARVRRPAPGWLPV